MPFVKGQSGNPLGRNLGRASGITDLARKHCPKAIATLVEIAEGDGSASARVSAASALLDRGYGKPPQFSTSDADQFRKAVEMTDDELASAISAIATRIRAAKGTSEETPDKAKLLKLVPVPTRPDTATG